ncbi:probable calcium-binding protein CML29 [Malania oleifera]|uniref:probable calcium-binding protein CML29 n=1 Tax=Malania oleifera TaxID=397392 RepID=UPI0025AE745E|nr:probable calcium-binding protein CML29 [Malania oleifera]
MERLSNVVSLVEAFRAFDADNDGLITGAELGGIMDSLGCGMKDQDVEAMMQQADTNRDGMLSMQEFLDMNTKDMQLGDLAISLRNTLEAFGVDREGVVTREELYEAMLNLGELSPEDCHAIVASMDADADGAVSLVDFRLILNSLL